MEIEHDVHIYFAKCNWNLSSLSYFARSFVRSLAYCILVLLLREDAIAWAPPLEKKILAFGHSGLIQIKVIQMNSYPYTYVTAFSVTF